MNIIAEQEDSEEEAGEEEDVNEEAPQAPITREVARMCNQLQLYLCMQGADETQMKALDIVLAFVDQKQNEKMKQSTLTDFFTALL